MQHENEVVDVPVVRGRRVDSDVQDAAKCFFKEVADSTALDRPPDARNVQVRDVNLAC